MTVTAALTRLRQGLGLMPVAVFRVCTVEEPMPTDADRRAWRHPDAQILTITDPFPPAVPRLLMECRCCGDVWTEPQ